MIYYDILYYTMQRAMTARSKGGLTLCVLVCYVCCHVHVFVWSLSLSLSLSLPLYLSIYIYIYTYIHIYIYVYTHIHIYIYIYIYILVIAYLASVIRSSGLESRQHRHRGGPVEARRVHRRGASLNVIILQYSWSYVRLYDRISYHIICYIIVYYTVLYYVI